MKPNTMEFDQQTKPLFIKCVADNYKQWDIMICFPSVNVYQSMDSDHPDIQVNMLLYLAMTGVQIKRFLHFLSLCSCINCTIAVKNVPRITIEWTQRTFYLQLREGQGSLLISKLEFFIKADFQGLGFFYKGRVQIIKMEI